MVVYLFLGLFYITGLPDRSFVMVLFVAGFAVRVLLAFILYFAYPPDGHIFRDDLYYMRTGINILEYWHGGGAFWNFDAYRVAASSRNWGYSFYNAIHFFMAPSHLLPSISNSFAGAMLAVSVYRLAFELFGTRVARISAILAMFHSGLIFYSSVNLKDILVTLTTILVLFYGVLSVKDRRPANFLKMIVASVVLFSLRFYIAPVVLGSVLLYWLVSRDVLPWRKIFLICVLVGCVIMFLKILPGVDRTRAQIEKKGGILKIFSHYAERNLEKVSAKRTRAIGRLVRPGISGAAVTCVWFLLNPNPFNCHDITWFLLPGVLLWYMLIPFVLTGAVGLIRQQFAAATLLVGFFSGGVLLYSLFPHLAIIRHRFPLTAVAIIVACWGLTRLRPWHKVLALFVWTILLSGMVFMKLKFGLML